MMMTGAVWRVLVVVSTVGAPWLGCAGDRAPEAPTPPPTSVLAAPTPTPTPVVPIVKTSGNNEVTIFPDGSSMIRHRLGDVAMLRRQPDGTYDRTCGPPDPETRTMMEGMMRARRGNR
jgi:hypothetical protein